MKNDVSSPTTQIKSHNPKYFKHPGLKGDEELQNMSNQMKITFEIWQNESKQKIITENL